MGVLLEVGDAASVVGEAISGLSANVATVIPAALGVSALVFGASYLWRKARKLVS